MNSTLQNILSQLSQSHTPDSLQIILSLLVSVGATVILYVIYARFYERMEIGSQIHRAFFIVGPATTAMFIVIQFSLPLSLGLLGALSFIRFRTPIKDPEEVAYMLCLIALSIASATFNYLVIASLLFITVSLAMIRKKMRGTFSADKTRGHLMISAQADRLKNGDLDVILGKLLENPILISLNQTGNTLNLHYTFLRHKEQGKLPLKDVTEVDGVDHVNMVMGAIEP